MTFTVDRRASDGPRSDRRTAKTQIDSRPTNAAIVRWESIPNNARMVSPITGASIGSPSSHRSSISSITIAASSISAYPRASDP